MDIIEMLSHDPLVLYAARVSHTFHLDPVHVLTDSADDIRNMVRTAATMVVQRDEEEQAAKARASSKRGRRR